MDEIRTSEPGWIPRLAKAYREKNPVYLIDDADVGIDPQKETIIQMGRRAKLEARDWVAVGVALGVAAAGAYLMIAAILDPEPFSKLGFVIAASATLIFGGSFTAVYILTKVKPPKVKVSKNGFEISW